MPLPPRGRQLGRASTSPATSATGPASRSRSSSRDGPSFAVDGHEVRWQKWRFRVGFTPREGLVLHTVSYRGRRARAADPLPGRRSARWSCPTATRGEHYYRKNAFDIGEYGIGTLANSLALGCDCLGRDPLLRRRMTDSRGERRHDRRTPSACTRRTTASSGSTPTGGPTQRRCGARAGWSVSFIATVGNYEYGFYWYFYQDGSHPVRGQADRHHEQRGLLPGEKPPLRRARSRRGSTRRIHQHFFGARLDMTVDGEQNSVVRGQHGRRLRAGPDNPHGNAFRAEATPAAPRGRGAAHRRPAAARASGGSSTRPAATRLGQPVGYRLVPGENVPAVRAARSAAVMQRAGFCHAAPLGDAATTRRSATRRRLPEPAPRRRRPAALDAQADRAARGRRPGALVHLRRTTTSRGRRTGR